MVWEQFDSTNPYQALAIVKADTEDRLVEMLRTIKGVYGVIQIMQTNEGKWLAFVTGDHRIKTQLKGK